MAAPGTTGSNSTSSRVIRSFLAQPLDVIRSIRSSYSSNNVYIYNNCKNDLLSLFWVNKRKSQGDISLTQHKNIYKIVHK